ncbi:MAG: molecular chaperone GroEL [Methanogenium sp.]|jgi:chaperonin GroEL
MGKKILFGQKGKSKIKIGINHLANAVIKTLGPEGKAAILDRGYNPPEVTRDGATIAREIILHDNVENIGASLIKQAAEKTNDAAGDGTTTSVLLAYSMINEGIKALSTGISSKSLEEGMHEILKVALEELDKITLELSSTEDLKNVATISCRDEELGKTIADVFEKCERKGIVAVGKSNSGHIEVENVQGIKLTKGYLSPYFVTDKEKMKAELDSPLIFLTDNTLSSIADIAPMLSAAVEKRKKKEILIIAQDITGDALAMLIVNKIKGNLNPVAIKSQGYGDRMKEYLQDIATLTGATVISTDANRTLDSISESDFGEANRVIVDKNETMILDGKGDEEAKKERVMMLKAMLEKKLPTEFEIEKLKDRLSWFTGGAGIIKVGAPTESEQNELYHRVEDAVNATKSAIAEGIVPGSGIALLKVSNAIKEKMGELSESVDVGKYLGAKIVFDSLKEPLIKIVENSGENGYVVLNTIMNSDKQNFGYDAKKKEYSEDMIKDGIIDPKKVVRCSLENATSVAISFLISDSVITDVIEKNEK